MSLKVIALSCLTYSFGHKQMQTSFCRYALQFINIPILFPYLFTYFMEQSPS